MGMSWSSESRTSKLPRSPSRTSSIVVGCGLTVGQRRVSAPAHHRSMNPIDEALRAVMASTSGNPTDAQHHLELARQCSRVCARRHRQLVEIAGLIVDRNIQRANGLALVHATEFPQDAELVDRLARAT